MDAATKTKDQLPSKELLDAQTHIANHIHYFHKTMALKCAVQLGIPDVIQKHGKPMTLTELANSLSLHPNKTDSLYRLMRLLALCSFFSEQQLPNNNNETETKLPNNNNETETKYPNNNNETETETETAFGLTINSELLLKDHPFSQSPFVHAILDPAMTDPAHHFSTWLLSDDQESPFYVAHGRNIWQHASRFPDFNDNFNRAMASDARLVGGLLGNNEEFKGLFEGIESIVDVGGGDGTLAKAIALAYPELKCFVFDLPHVVQGLNGCVNNCNNLEFVAGDMFAAIPSARAILLKMILHDWGDDDCIKILRKCKEALENKGKGGKVIIIDMVIGIENNNPMHYTAQLLLDMQMLSITNGGKQRTEEEWKRLFINAGFHHYKIYSKLGPRSVIEVYPN